MKAQLVRVIAEIDERPPPIAPDEVSENKAFLAWLGNEHYTFLGYRCHDLVVLKERLFGRLLGVVRDGMHARAPRAAGQYAGADWTDEAGSDGGAGAG